MNNAELPAMPPHAHSCLEAYMGLTKREYIASMALQGILASGADPAFADDWALVCADNLLKRLE
jgi:hypothetical protein